MKTGGDKIRLLRTIKGYSQKGLATTTGLKQENISYIESNKMKKNIKPEIFEKLATAFNMKPEELENFNPTKLIYNNFQDNAKQEIFIQNLTFNNQEKIIALQNDTIDTLQKLNEMYKKQLQCI